MPNTVTRQRNGRIIDVGLERIVVVEMYKVAGLASSPNWINSIADPPIPQRGDLHPLGGPGQVYEGAVVESVRLSQWISKDVALVGVVYRRQLTRYSGGPRRLTRSFSRSRNMPLPIWRRLLIDGVVWYEEDRTVIVPRMVFTRIETRFLAGSQNAAVLNAIALNTGKIYTIDGQQYLLSDHADVLYDGRAYTRVDYAFERHCDLPAIGAGNPQYRNAVAIPALPANHVYSSGLNESAFPVITVAPITTAFGGTLPGFP